ncbi:MAG: SUMF1/EgtB/PvdO family nonheme iron enzyme [Geminicoccaceae bacterium]
MDDRSDADVTSAALITISGGRSVIGCTHGYPEERPRMEVDIASFRLDRFAVSNTAFAAFVDATGHVTTAEKVPDRDLHPNMPDAFFAAGSLVFVMTPAPVALDDPGRWWHFVPGANWRHPEGPGSDLGGRWDHPVVHVSLDDARAYAAFIGARLPGEAEWEHAARAGATTRFPWGGELEPGGRPAANVWRGDFPWRHERCAGPPFTMPVDAFAPNAFGLCNMIGNVWEWTDTPFAGNHRAAPDHAELYVTKGGSHLCAASYCQRYRPEARMAQARSATFSHLGFRCAGDVAPSA